MTEAIESIKAARKMAALCKQQHLDGLRESRKARLKSVRARQAAQNVAAAQTLPTAATRH